MVIMIYTHAKSQLNYSLQERFEVTRYFEDYLNEDIKRAKKLEASFNSGEVEILEIQNHLNFEEGTEGVRILNYLEVSEAQIKFDFISIEGVLSQVEE